MTPSTLTEMNHEVTPCRLSPLPRRASDGLSVAIVDLPRGFQVSVAGAAGTHNLDPLDYALIRMVARRAQFVVLDFSELTFLSSLAMGCLVRLRRDLARWGGRVQLAGTQPAVRESLEAARLGDLFEFYATVADAVAAT